MDIDRARTLLTAERDEVLSLLKDSESAGRDDREAEVASEAEDNADAALALTEEGQDDAIAESLRDRLEVIERALRRRSDPRRAPGGRPRRRAHHRRGQGSRTRLSAVSRAAAGASGGRLSGRRAASRGRAAR
jgi:hypothetical protein